MRELAVRLVMLSDWHVGTGAGRHGVVDRAVQRDRDGLPFVPAKSVTGVWRDACEIAAAALDGDGNGNESGKGNADGDGVGDGGGTPPVSWQAWVDYLFGSQPALEDRNVLPSTGTNGPQAASLLVGAAHYPAQVATALAGQALLKAAAVFVKPGVRIDPHTDAAAPGMLRFEEMGRCGAVLTGSAELPAFGTLDAEQQKAVCALLAAGAGLVEGLGGKRRRGAGRCRLELPGLGVDWEWLGSGPEAPALPSRVPAAAPADDQGSATQSAASQDEHDGDGEGEREWEAADLRLVLEQPVVAHERTVGNAVRSLDHVPGWMLLPAVLERLRSGEAAAAAARAGRLVVTHAVPEVDGGPGRHVPMVLVHAKEDEAEHRNLMAEAPGAGFRGEAFESGYVGAYTAGRSVRVDRGERSEHMHNTVDDTVQRPTERVGGLYSYQAIAESSVLRAQVRVPAGLLPEGWQDRLSGTWRIGRSRKDGYGRVRVAAAKVEPQPLRTGTGTGTGTRTETGARTGAGDGAIRVWLLSDVLVTDARLRPSTDPADLAAALGRELGVRLAVSAPAEDGRAVQAGAVRRTDTWHRRWGLPRGSLLGLSAGTCLQFDVLDGHVDPRAVSAVETGGVGARRAEGFGQVLIDDPLLSATLARSDAAGAIAETETETVTETIVEAEARARPDVRPTPPAPGSTALGPEGSDAASDPNAPDDPDAVSSLRAITRAAWRREIRRRSEAVAATLEGRNQVLGSGHKNVPPTQFGHLRTLLHQLTGPGDTRAGTWLEKLTQTRIRDRSWPTDVRERLRVMFTEPDRVWAVLTVPEKALATNGAPASGMRSELWPEAVRELVDDCLTAHARAKDSNGEAR